MIITVENVEMEMRQYGGDPTSKICLVGEAHGVYERNAKKPFVGSTGQLLMKIMHLVGLARTDCYITNVVKEHPPGDDFTIFCDIKKGFKSEKYKWYVEMLRQELEQTSANVIVAVGASAMYALTGLTAITKRRGSILESTLVSGRKVMPIIHPSAAARKYIYEHFMRVDLRRAVEESVFPEIRLPNRDIQIGPSYFDVIAYLGSIKHEQVINGNVTARDIIAFDIEVVNEEISCISVAKSATDVMSIPFLSKGNEYFDPEQELEVWLELSRILEDSSIIKIGQNLTFDCSFLYRKMRIKTRNINDTMIAIRIAYPDFPKGLDFITSMFTKEPYYKDEGKKWFKIGGDERSFWTYNAKDSAVCMEAFPKIMRTIKKQGNEDTYERQRLLIPILVYMQERGMRVDVEGMKQASVQAEADIARMQAELCEVSGQDLNPNSPKQLVEYFYEKKRIKPYYDKGKITTNDDAMRRLARKGIKEAILIRDIRKIRKLKGTYLDMTLSSDSRMRSAMNPVGTKTGRLSSSQDIFGEGGNVQTLPEFVKTFIVADEGMVLYNVDLGQAENRIVAVIAPEPIMRDAFAMGIDLHSLTAHMISAVPFEDIIRQDRDGIKCNLGTGEQTWRFWGKKCNHSLDYDLGYRSFALRLDLQEPEAKTIVERWHQIYPGIRQYHAWIKTQLYKDRTLENLMGRKRTFLDRWGDDLFKEAYAHIPQSTVADVINERGLEYIYYNQQDFKPVDLLNQVHDSIVFQIPLSVSWEQHATILKKIKASLETPLKWHGEEFVIPADIKICVNLGKKGGREVTVSEDTIGLARQLHDLYEQLRTIPSVQAVEWDIDDSSSFEEEG